MQIKTDCVIKRTKLFGKLTIILLGSVLILSSIIVLGSFWANYHLSSIPYNINLSSAPYNIIMSLTSYLSSPLLTVLCISAIGIILLSTLCKLLEPCVIFENYHWLISYVTTIFKILRFSLSLIMLTICFGVIGLISYWFIMSGLPSVVNWDGVFRLTGIVVALIMIGMAGFIIYPRASNRDVSAALCHQIAKFK